MSTLPTNINVSPFSPVILQDKIAAVLKHIAQSERLVAVRPASRLEVRPRPEIISTSIAELDALTEGIPRGCLTEIYGASSSGKTSVLLATIAAATRRQESCALIDASDSFDPSSGTAAGLNFNKLLWVRCGTLSVVRRRSARQQRVRVPHPSASFAEGGDFEVASDARRTTQDEGRLEQVLKSTDLILQSGGFGLVALDLAGIPDKFVRRIPLASWFRFQRAIEHTKTALLVVSEFPCAQTCAALVMKTHNQPSAFSHQPSEKPSHAQVLKEMRVEAEILRSRLAHNENRKPMQSTRTSFMTQAVRAG
jgi:hypothetical protein